MTRRAFVLLLLVVSLMGTPLGAQPAPANGEPLATAPQPKQDGVPEDVQTHASGQRGFAFELYGVLRAEPGNLMVSPYSISAALGMTWAGARGETAAQMARALHLGLPTERLHAASAALDRLLASRAEPQRRGEEGFRLEVANALWGQQGHPFQPDFLALLQRHYGAGLEQVDFAADPEGNRRRINEWVEAHTEDRIQDLLPPGSIDSSTRLVLVNAVYFLARWASQFEEAWTRAASFTRLDGSQCQVEMMRQIHDYRHASGDGWSAIELPYEGRQLAMLIILPDRDRFGAIEAGLDEASYERIVGALSWDRMDLRLPRFTFESAFSLKDALAALGMPLAFTARADFSGMDGRRELFIGDVVHKTFIRVYEGGTEAAAATAVEMTAGSVPSEPIPFVIDRPFIFAIRDIPTGTILFLGRTLEPSN